MIIGKLFKIRFHLVLILAASFFLNPDTVAQKIKVMSYNIFTER